MASRGPGNVTRLLQSWKDGDKRAMDELLPLVYRELRGVAAACLRRERRGHTLQPTALVHEAYLKLVGQPDLELHNRSHFLAIAANLMRQILVSHARQHRAAKRWGGSKVELEEDSAAVQPREVDLIALDQALDALARFDARQSRVIELRFFGGLTEEEIAEVLGISEITVKRHYRIARAFLYGQLHHGASDAGERA